MTEDGALIYFARDGLTARAMDLASGAERWQVGLQDVDKVQAEVLHKLAPHRLLLQVPGLYFALDTTRGLPSSRSGPPTWTLVWRGGGACALCSTCHDRLRRRAPARSGATRTRRPRDVW